MWGFGKSHTNVWSTLVANTSKQLSLLEATVEELLPPPTFSTKSSSTAPSSAQYGLSMNSSDLQDDNFILVWDPLLGPAPFSSPRVLANLVSFPCAANAPYFINQQDLANITECLSRPRAKKALQTLIVCTSASMMSLDLSSLAPLLVANSAEAESKKFEKIENIHLILASSPKKASTEGARFLHKIAPLTHTAVSSITVHQLPLLHLPLGSKFFQLIADPGVFGLGTSPSNLVASSSPVPPLSRPLMDVSNRARYQADFDLLPSATREQYTSLAKSFARLSSDLAVRLEAWALGPSSELIAHQLMQLTSMQEGASSGEKVSLILVDRSLDLLSPCLLGQKGLLDRLTNANDFKALHSISGSPSSSPKNAIQGLHIPNPVQAEVRPSDRSDHDNLISILSQNPKHALAGLMRKLSDLATEEQLEIDFSVANAQGAMRALKVIYEAWSGTTTGRNRLYQHRRLLLALELACSMQDERFRADGNESTHFSSVAHILSSSGDSLMEYVKDYLVASKSLPVASVIRVVVALCMLGYFIRQDESSSSSKAASKSSGAESGSPKEGDTTKDQGRKEEASSDAAKSIQELLIARLADSQKEWTENIPPWLSDLDFTDKEALASRVAQLFDFLSSEGPIEFEDFQTFQESQKAPCLLAQIVDRVFDPRKPDLRDIHQTSLSVGGLLKSGLSMISLRHQPRPNDRSQVILFVVGGITMAEVSQIQETLRKIQGSESLQLIVGSFGVWSTLQIVDLYCK